MPHNASICSHFLLVQTDRREVELSCSSVDVCEELIRRPVASVETLGLKSFVPKLWKCFASSQFCESYQTHLLWLLPSPGSIGALVQVGAEVHPGCKDMRTEASLYHINWRQISALFRVFGIMLWFYLFCQQLWLHHSD